MASRPVWRGHIRLALVSCPVGLYSAKHDRGSIRFHLINPETGNRIKMLTVDGETKEELKRGDLVKGYEFKKNNYLIVTDEDFDSVKVETSSTMKVEKFVEADSIDPIYYDSSYYLAPDGKGGEDVYAVLRKAIQKTGRVALSRVVIAQRERTVAIRVIDGGLVAQTLHEERDLNSPKELFEDAQKVKTDQDMVDLAVQLIDRQTGRYDPADIEDRYETRLRAMIDARLEGENMEDDTQTDHAADQGNVIDLMAALKKSLGVVAPEGQKPAEPKRAAKAKKGPSPEEARRQPGLKLSIAGGRKVEAGKAVRVEDPAPAAAKPSRKRA